MEVKTIDLFKQGYFSVPVSDDLTKKIKNLSGLWDVFCLQKQERKESHIFTKTGGYEYKGPEQADHKENFHLTLEYELSLFSTDTDFEFIDAGKKLITGLMPTVKNVADQISNTTGINLSDVVCSSQKNWIVRFLHYFPQNKPDGIIAAPHADKGTFTVHLTESSGGFQVLWGDRWRDVPGTEGYVHGYPGLLGQYLTECKTHALCHRVVQDEISKKNGRTSIVVFIDLGGKGEVYYDKATYGTSQSVFPAGQNYGMDFEQFKKYFLPVEQAVL